MKLSSLDMLKIVAAILTIGNYLSGTIDVFYSGSVLFLLVVGFFYYKIPWAHKKWETNTMCAPVVGFYCYSKILHKGIVISMTILIVTSFATGLIVKSGPNIIANQTAKHVGTNKTWGDTSIKSSNVPVELRKIKTEDQPYAIIVKKNSLKAVPLQKILSKIAGSFSSSFVNFSLVLFLLVCVTGMVLYPTELLADTRNIMDNENP